ncbi:MAG: ABC transporter permease [Gammaproteobacteria bacterium]|nr:ABC transporter permease [Gammaproteobacteria bacterium]
MADTARLGIGYYLRLSLRNLLRNPRRTGITLITMVFGISTLTLLGALNDGWLNQMKTNFILSFTGHIQIHSQGFEASQSLQDSISEPDEILRYTDYAEIIGWTLRIRTSGLASLGGSSAGVQIMATDPEQETWVTSIHENISAGRWLSPGMADDLLLGRNVAQSIGAKLGDKIILMAQRANGEMVSEVFYLRGVLATGAPQIDRTLAVIPLHTAQHWLALQNSVTDIVLRTEHHDDTDALHRLLVQHLSTDRYEILRWEELDPMVSQWLNFSDAYGLVVIFVVILLVLTEILNTMLIALHDRQKELGIMVAIGTKKSQIFLMMMLEAVILILLGSLLGYLSGGLIVYFLGDQGIDLSHFSNAFQFFYMDPVIQPLLTQDSAIRILGTTFVAALIAGIYPAWKAAQLPVTQSIRIQ